MAIEAWNSYAASYPRPLQIDVTDIATVTLTNAAGLNWSMPLTFVGSSSNIYAGFWRGRQFLLPINEKKILLPPSIYRFASRTFEPVGASNVFEKGFPIPEWNLTLSNQFLYVLSENGQILDFVVSKDATVTVDIDNVLMQESQLVGPSGTRENAMVARMWDTNRTSTGGINVPTEGILRQIMVCVGMLQVGDDVWKSYMDDAARGLDKTKAIAVCQRFFNQGQTRYPNVPVDTTSLTLQSPFCPTRKLVKTTTWQVDDPMVHYHFGDLLVYPTNSILEFVVPPTAQVPTNMSLASLGRMNRRYSPWGGSPELNSDPSSPTDPYAYDLTLKDPGVRSSEDWDFPTNRFPSIGWLGRVHRGTPWQTVYFKHIEPEASPESWQHQSSEYLWSARYWYRAHPTNDWALADLFTTATDENSTRGLLSVNQANLPAWSAVLGGVTVLQNVLPDRDLLTQMGTNVQNSPIPLQPTLILPVANDTPIPPATAPPLAQFVIALNAHRAGVPNGIFTNLAQFLQVPELTVGSPWLNTVSPIQQRLGLNDTAYERLPQQILSLVKVGEPRFVVYAYGQALKPATDSIDTSRGNVCTNYQVTSEVATRAVIRVNGFFYFTNTTTGVVTTNVTTSLESFNLLPPD